MRRAVLIYNPTSGRQLATRRLPAIVRDLEAGGFQVETLPTGGPGDATRLARDATDRDVEVAFALGGDGTLREVAAGLLGSEVALGALPAGTTNVMALALGLPQDAGRAARVLPRCERKMIDAGMAGEELFLMCATGGLDGAVMRWQDSTLKKRFGKAAMVLPALRQWWDYDYPEIELRFDGRSARPSYFAVCNIPYYAGAFRMAPDADLYDQRLDLVLFHGRGRGPTLGLARDLALERHLRRPDVERVLVESVEVLGPPGLPIQIDGDVPPVELPLRISLPGERLWVLAPPSKR